VTASVKAALVAAFEELGGVAALVEWGRKKPTEFYALWAKLLPAELKVTGDGGFLTLNVIERVVTSAEPTPTDVAPPTPAA
jgi:hypothetical protein